MAIPRATKIVQKSLERAKGVGDALLSDPSAQAENLVRQGSSALNSGIKVIESFKDSVEDIFSGSTIDVANKIGLSTPSFEQQAEVITQTALNPNLILGSTDNVILNSMYLHNRKFISSLFSLLLFLGDLFITRANENICVATVPELKAEHIKMGKYLHPSFH